LANRDEWPLNDPLPVDDFADFFTDGGLPVLDLPVLFAAGDLSADFPVAFSPAVTLPEGVFFGAGLAVGGSGAWGLMVIGLPTFGLTTKGFGPGFDPATGLPSAVRFGPAPGGGTGVFPAGRAAAWGPAGRNSSALAASDFCPDFVGGGAGGLGRGSDAPRFGNRSLAAVGLTACTIFLTFTPWSELMQSAPN
jgi:hypothetical protein